MECSIINNNIVNVCVTLNPYRVSVITEDLVLIPVVIGYLARHMAASNEEECSSVGWSVGYYHPSDHTVCISMERRKLSQLSVLLSGRVCLVLLPVLLAGILHFLSDYQLNNQVNFHLLTLFPNPHRTLFGLRTFLFVLIKDKALGVVLLLCCAQVVVMVIQRQHVFKGNFTLFSHLHVMNLLLLLAVYKRLPLI